MAIIIHSKECNFRPNPNKIDGFRLFTDIARSRNCVNPQYLNFDLRRLDPGQYNAPYHFHRHAEELFMILSGAATLRTPDGLTLVSDGDIIFFEAGENGAHQLHNSTDKPCIYLDIRSYIGHDICEYPDSGKIIIVPGGEIFRHQDECTYFEGEDAPDSFWEKLR